MRDWEVTHHLECLVNNIRVREIVVGKEVELVQKIPYVNTTKRVHLGEGQHAREAERYVSTQCFIRSSRIRHLRLFFTWLFWCVPADIDDFVKFFEILNRHRHVVVGRNNLGMLVGTSARKKKPFN